jgi:MerR family transcriptional regulator, redox-sensitive transcriptional activator SoxR
MKCDAMLSVGEVSRRSGVAVSALHFYEAQGLITSTRNAGNQRRYRRSAIRRIAVIRVAQSLGVSLAEIANELRQLPDQRTPTKADWARLSSHWRVSLDQRIADLQALRDKLEGCIGCGCLSLRACKLYNANDTLSRRGPGPHRLTAVAPIRNGNDKG